MLQEANMDIDCEENDRMVGGKQSCACGEIVVAQTSLLQQRIISAVSSELIEYQQFMRVYLGESFDVVCFRVFSIEPSPDFAIKHSEKIHNTTDGSDIFFSR